MSRVNDDNQAQPVRCPTCRKPVTDDLPSFPFCCKRCRTIDLGKWLDGSYTISRPVEQADIEDDV